MLTLSKPKGSHPHHLVLVADPQIIDPHSYPNQPWPISSLVMMITDNYLRRGYGALQRRLQPDSLFFLGDLFDGGREWTTRQGEFVDPQLGRKRPTEEANLLDKWHHKYGEDYWLQEYDRFSDIFLKPFAVPDQDPGAWQRGRKLVASLPGNHDLGFGAQVQLPVRDRFEAFFGDANRVDMIGNHSIVSIDAVSLSADTSDYRDRQDVRPVYEPVRQFLEGVKTEKHRAMLDELDAWYGPSQDSRYPHRVVEADNSDTSDFPLRSTDQSAADFPTILLTHVPLYRAPGTPCGPMREHWPPQKPPSGQTEPVTPDGPNSITVAGGYQYQNVLSEEDSVRLIQDIGNVVHVFSGDDHDYCELTHSDSKENVREVTVKSISMAMGVPTPGFLLVSLYNPVDESGRPLPGAPSTTIQTHLCLLPTQIHTWVKYACFAVATIMLLVLRAMLVPVLHLQPFALDPSETSTGNGYSLLPTHKEKLDPPPENSSRRSPTLSTATPAHHLPTRLAATASRGRSASTASTGSNGSGAGYNANPPRWQSRKNQRWGWGGDESGGRRVPRITLDEDYYESNKRWRGYGSASYSNGGGSSSGRPRLGKAALRVALREMWTTTWRVVWMAGLFWLYLAISEG